MILCLTFKLKQERIPFPVAYGPLQWLPLISPSVCMMSLNVWVGCSFHARVSALRKSLYPDGLCPGSLYPGDLPTAPAVDRMIDASENIIFLAVGNNNYQNPLGPNHPRTAEITPGTAGLPKEPINNIQSFLPNVIFLFKTTIKKAKSTVCAQTILDFQIKMIILKEL